MLLLKTNEPNFKAQFDELLRRGHMDMENVSKIVLNIIAEIKAEGNGALKNHIEKFDKWRVESDEALEVKTSDMKKAYDALDDETKQHLETLQLITYNPFVRFQSNKGAPKDGGYGTFPKYRFKDQPVIGHAYPHPLVRTHPESGRKALWLNTHNEVELVNYDDQAGSELIAKLREHILKPEFHYEHHWEQGDIVFWDNQATLHSRRPFPADQRRLLKRISLAGGRPY